MTATTQGNEAACRVVTEPMLWPHIMSFLPGVPVWTVEYERRFGCQHKETEEQTQHKGQRNPLLLRRGIPGLLPRLAIQKHDLATLKRLYFLHNSQPTIRKMGRFWPRSVMHDAAVEGNLKLLQWVHEHTNEPCRSYTLTHTLRAGHWDVADWLLQHRPDSTQEVPCEAINIAAAAGRLDIIQRLRACNPEPWPSRVLDTAATSGHLEVVKFLKPHFTEEDASNAMAMAAANGQLDVVQWLHEVGSPRSSEAMLRAVQGRHVNVVEFLWETRDAELDAASCPTMIGLNRARLVAVAGGSCKILRLMIERAHLTFPAFALARAAAHGQLDVIKLLLASRPREDVVEAFRCSAKHPAVTRFLLEHHTFEPKLLRQVAEKLQTETIDTELDRLLKKQLGIECPFRPSTGGSKVKSTGSPRHARTRRQSTARHLRASPRPRAPVATS
ncbi:hypothetical protein PINS_up009346 [Pythium insidiosum]|nr:hypothetical protein PINS_up009346 [Pythium insidiosum]